MLLGASKSLGFEVEELGLVFKGQFIGWDESGAMIPSTQICDGIPEVLDFSN